MRKGYILLFTIPCVLLLLFNSCSYFNGDDRVLGGQKLDDELMSEIRAEIFSTSSESVIYEESVPYESESASLESEEDEVFVTEDEMNTDVQNSTSDTFEKESAELSESQTVYWSKNGEVWHIYDTCRYLKNANEIYSGSIEDAIIANKTKQCSVCTSASEN